MAENTFTLDNTITIHCVCERVCVCVFLYVLYISSEEMTGD